MRSIIQGEANFGRVFCGREVEIVDHLFSQCTFTRFQWNSFLDLMECAWVFSDSFITILSSLWCNAIRKRKDTFAIDSSCVFVVCLERMEL